MDLASEVRIKTGGEGSDTQRAARGVVFDVMRFSTHDGPGIRTTVFLKGCPLNCAWCHNPESQSARPEALLRPNLCIACLACIQACPEGAIRAVDGQAVTDRTICTVCGTCLKTCPADARAIAGREMAVDEVLAEIVKDEAFFEESGGGVTFSGGDPLAQSGFLLALLEACKRREIHTAVETAGYAPWAAFERIRPFVDLFLFDLKLADPELHRKYTGVDNAPILANLRRLAEAGSRLVVRIPLIPGVNDGATELAAVGAFVATLPGVVRVDVLPYHRAGAEKYRRLGRDYLLDELAAPSESQVSAAIGCLRQCGLDVHVGG
ncbi:MAG TPA: glycyl-radical enzyme activating protein [Armatimonadota bacterium]